MQSPIFLLLSPKSYLLSSLLLKASYILELLSVVVWVLYFSMHYPFANFLFTFYSTTSKIHLLIASVITLRAIYGSVSTTSEKQMPTLTCRSLNINNTFNLSQFINNTTKLCPSFDVKAQCNRCHSLFTCP